MKVKLTNFEIERYVGIIFAPESFRNNVGVKISAEMDWALRINIKAMTDRLEIFNNARNDLSHEFIDAGKVDGEMVKEEFIPEYNERMSTLYNLMNELDFAPIPKDELKKLEILSMPERDLLNLMVEKDIRTEESK